MWLLLRGEGLNLGRLNILLAIKLREMYVRIILQQWLCRVLVTLSSASSPLDLRSSATPSSTSPLSSGGSLLDTMYQDTISFEMHVFTLPYIFSTPATRDCVHSVSTVHPWRSSSTISPPETMRQWWNNSICNFTFSIITRLKKKQSLKTSSAWEQLTQYKRQLSSWAWDLEPMVRNNQRFVNLVHVDSSSWLPVPGYLHSPCQMIICSGLLEKVWTRWLKSQWVSPLPKYLVPRASPLQVLKAHSALMNMCAVILISLPTASSMGRRSSTSAHMTWWQPRWGIGDNLRDHVVVEIDIINGEQAGGVLQAARKAQHAAGPWLGQVQADGEQFWPSDLN